MQESLERKLYEKYPKIFADQNLDVSRSCMAWGMMCGDGWYSLIDSLCGFLQSYTDNNKVPQIVAEQVKEKFGGLRFYVRGGNEFTSGAITFAEIMSEHTCELCGNPGKLGGEGWLVTMCEEHRLKRKNNVDE